MKITGTAGNDTLTVLTNTDSVQAGVGTDTIVFAGNYADYTFSQADSYVSILTHNTTGQVVSLYQVERLQFDDTAASLTTTPASGEFQVNTYTTSNQTTPCIAALNDGGFVVTWQSLGQDGDGDGIYAQRYDVNGDVNGAEFQVNTYTTSSQWDSSIAALSDGGFVVTWISAYQENSLAHRNHYSDDGGIFAQRYDVNGDVNGAEFQVNTYTTGHQGYPNLTALSDGGFQATWRSRGQDVDGSGIYGQRYDVNGDVNGAEFNVSYEALWSIQNSSNTAALNDGGFVVTTSSWGQDGDGGGIYAQRYDANGDALGEVTLNRPPTLNSTISNSLVNEDMVYSYDASSSFSDADGDTLSYTAKLSNGNGLPSWLSISSTGTLSGTPANADLGAIEVTVTATDSSAAAASDTFTLTVTDLSPITLSTYAESNTNNFIYNSYKDLMGSTIDTELWMFWTGKLNSGEADKSSYLRMLGELPGDKLALINIDVEGSVGKDSFDSKSGDGVTESFDGGSGIDTVTFDTAKSVISKTASGFTVGGDTLTNIERLSFTDEDIALDIDGANSAGGIYRTYKAAFNRNPEKTGFGYWIDRADNGASAVQMAEEFVWSAEFQTLYGVTTTDNYLVGNDVEAVVDLFYRNVLGRTPDQGGLDYYASTIVAQDKTGGRVLAEIADSAENRTNLLPTIENGMQYDLWLG